MNSIDLAILNLNEVRRRSLKIWESLPEEAYSWRPDVHAMTCLEMIRHVIESEHYYHQAIENRGDVPNYESPLQNSPLVSPQQEMEYARKIREDFIQTISSFSESDLSDVKIDRSNAGYIRGLGDMLLRIAYHESIHTGQLLDYLRTAGADRAKIWD
ncbi:DinB family protein [Metabacillus sp. GX 13764]|uniref:DinB family protein n=1 Tax=Metabacillus kandeliae TaxID=2900151 RepID=UPI001E5F401C|nr:DinB family protein [Metabacillus kandeliae]MCD7034262.1 DinB family protein [Metabacillus kandeliae]